MTKNRKPKVGLSLGSGGARGWCHIGVLQELDKMGLRPHVISGSSMGALVGAVYAAGALDDLDNWARSLTKRQFITMFDVSLASGGIIEGAAILGIIQRIVKLENLEDLPVPMAVVATDMATGREVWMTAGNIAKAVRASVALPGVISPFRIDDRWFLDGGLTNPLPVTACRILGADVVIAVNPNGRMDGTFWADRGAEKAEEPASQDGELWVRPGRVTEFLGGIFETEDKPEYLEVVATSIDIMSDSIRRSKLAGDPPHVLLEAHLAQISVLEFDCAAEAIEEGRRVVKANSEAIARCARL